MLSLDYTNGRMVKLSIRELEPGVWETISAPHVEYQSWAHAYPTTESLIAAVGGEIIPDEGGQ